MGDFPVMAATRIELPLAANGPAGIKPGDKDGIDSAAFRKNAAVISSDGREVRVDPHYWGNTGDAYYLDGKCHVRMTTLAGFPNQIRDRAGVRQGVVDVLSEAQKRSTGTTAAQLAEIVQLLSKPCP